jgi:hypothetical protein
LSGTAEERYGDVALLLYATPFILNFAYALYLWSGAGFSSVLPQLVYLEVTQSPYIFLIGFAAVALAAVIDFNEEPATSKRSVVYALSKRLQAIAFISLFLAFIAALYAADGNLGNGVYNILDGRFPLVFAALLVFFSFMILPAVKLQGANMRNLIIILLLIASPAALYELGKHDTIAGLGVGLILLLIAALLLVRGKKE